MIPRFAKIFGLTGAAVIAACVDMSAPKNSPSSISAPQLPGLFVVRGDVMRDSLGNAAKPVIRTFDANGNPTEGFTPTFFLTDSNPAAHFNADGVLVGDRYGTVHLVGQIGNLQTTALIVAVTSAPDTLIASKIDTIRAPVGSDSTKSLGSQAAAVTVKGGAKRDSTIQGMIVTYAVLYAPASSSSTQPVAYLTDDSGNPSSADTTDGSGLASRRVVVQSTRIKDPAVLSGKTDSVVVEARAKYRGGSLPGSPVRLVFPVKVTFALP